MAKVTIEDISRHTGLSRGTVSRALNNRPDVSEQTRKRVLEACQRLNYCPSHAARSLATGKAYAVAVLLDNLHSAFQASFLRGVLNQAHTVRYAVHVAEVGRSADEAASRVRAAVGEWIDCVLIAGVLDSAAQTALREALEDRPLTACAELEGLLCDVLRPDQRECGRLAARHLLSIGTRKLLYVHAPAAPGAADRLAGFLEVCQQHGLASEQIVFCLPEAAPVPADLQARLERRLAQVQAVAATDDFVAAWLYGVCRGAGRTPGRDIALVGQGNELPAASLWPALTTVDLCGEEIGRRAFDTVLARLNRLRQDAPQTVDVAPRLLVRDSTASVVRVLSEGTVGAP
jgi:DNA-binding LacI/PurR family transcriptional regulator